MKILNILSILYLLLWSMTSCKQDTKSLEIPNLCKIKISTYNDFENFDLFGVTMSTSSGTSILYDGEYKKLGNACQLRNTDFESGEKEINFLFFDKSKNELEIVTFGIDIIAREEERKILKIRIQGYNNGNQIIDTMFTFHSINNDELPPTGSILDINTYQINLIN